MTTLLQDYATRQAGVRPEAVALVMGDARLTYGELEEASNKLARLLSNLGCRSGDRVCLFLAKSPHAVVSMLATLKIGCAYVPIDISSPAARVEKVVRAVEPRAAFVCEEAVGLLNQLASSGVLADATALVSVSESRLAGAEFVTAASATDWDDFDAGALPRAGSEGGPAHLLFTSGSTGAPKGVVITHANVAHFVEWAVRYFEIAPGDRLSGHPPLHFDLSTLDIFGTFAAGAELHLVPPQVSIFPHHLAEFVRRDQLTQFFAVPSVLTLMASFDVVRHDDFPALERILWCGEVLPTRTLRYWMERLPHVSFTNLYGPTETTIASSFYTVRDMPKTDVDSIPIGVACDGEELVVLNEHLLPVGPDEVGEIYIGGAGLSPGYWRDPEQTRRAFVPDPRSQSPWARIYRTGDLGRAGEDGLVHFVGRADSQIKHRGYRIELGEIESALSALASVRECAVVSVEADGFEGTTICCAYVPATSGVDERTLRSALREFLPQYMLPTAWLALDSLPTNPNGKIDRPRLRDMFRELRAETSGSRARSAARALE